MTAQFKRPKLNYNSSMLVRRAIDKPDLWQAVMAGHDHIEAFGETRIEAVANCESRLNEILANIYGGGKMDEKPDEEEVKSNELHVNFGGGR